MKALVLISKAEGGADYVGYIYDSESGVAPSKNIPTLVNIANGYDTVEEAVRAFRASTRIRLMGMKEV